MKMTEKATSSLILELVFTVLVDQDDISKKRKITEKRAFTDI